MCWRKVWEAFLISSKQVFIHVPAARFSCQNLGKPRIWPPRDLQNPLASHQYTPRRLTASGVQDLGCCLARHKGKEFSASGIFMYICNYIMQILVYHVSVLSFTSKDLNACYLLCHSNAGAEREHLQRSTFKPVFREHEPLKARTIRKKKERFKKRKVGFSTQSLCSVLSTHIISTLHVYIYIYVYFYTTRIQYSFYCIYCMFLRIQ